MSAPALTYRTTGRPQEDFNSIADVTYLGLK